MPSANLERYREQLRDMRDRMLGEVDRVVESIHEDLNPAGNISNAPVHMADAAPENLESDINVIETERGMLEEIQAAIHRIDAGTFGTCEHCGQPIPEERLRAIPYAAHCVACASSFSTAAGRSAT
jgi:DnaK suppressor protein